MNDNKNLLETLIRSRLYQDYERSFTEATGLPVSLHSAEAWQLPHHGRLGENPFCAMMARTSRTCAACLQVQQQLTQSATREPQTVVCHFGLSDTAVPVQLGEKVVGFLKTGQVFRKKPTEAQFARGVKLMTEWGITMDEEKLRAAFFGTRLLSSRQHESVVKLLGIFGQHLAMVSNQLVMQQGNSEAPLVQRAKEFILAHHAEELSLGAVAKAVNTSTFYFCKLFKKATGLNFTSYVSRVRLEKAKNLLLNPNLRISEIAYEVGFQSLTHFNRVFKKIVGQAPTEYRKQLPAQA